MENKKGSENIWWIVIGAILALLVGGFLLFLLSSDARDLARDIIGMKPSDQSLWRQKCDNACSTGQMQAKDCTSDWVRVYCGASYNDTMNCGQAENEGYISQCAHEIAGVDCAC